MARKLVSGINNGVTLATGATALALPPTGGNYGDVEAASWNADLGAYPEFELEIWADGARALTAATLYGAHLHDLTFADLTVTADNTTDELAAATHGKLTGDGPCLLTTTGTFPGGTDGTTEYYVIEGSDAGHLKLATSRANALAGTAVDLTSDGTGTIKLVDVDGETERVHWHSHGLLGLEEDGAISLTAQGSYMARCRHTPRAFAYAITATFGAGAGTVYAQIFPSVEVV